jgi:uncharacterized protein YegL
MPYEAEANSLTPALIIYLLDVSASMEQLLEGATRISIVNQALETVLKRTARLSLKGTQIAPRYRLAMIAYSDQPMDIFGEIKPINDVIALGRPMLQTFDATNTYAAFEVAKELLEEEIPRTRGLKNHPAPMVCHLTDGEYNGNDPEPLAHEIMNMATPDGNVLVENIFIGPDLLKRPVGNAREWSGITSASELNNDYGRQLFAMSSALPPSYAAVMQRAGFAMQPGARMLIPGVSRELVELAFAMSGATPVGDAPRLAAARG